MAVQYKIKMKETIDMQEYITGPEKWYVDSDIDTKWYGGAELYSGTTPPTEVASTTINANGSTTSHLGNSIAAIALKNLGKTAAGADSAAYIHVSLNGTSGTYLFRIAPGETFSSNLASAADGANSVYVKTDGTAEQTIRYIKA